MADDEVAVFESEDSPELGIWCDDERAEELGVEKNKIEFSAFTYHTEDSAEIQYLRENEEYGRSYIEVTNEASSAEWRERLQDVDDIKLWSDEVFEHFKNGGDVIRCGYECGYASTTRSAVTRHENNRCTQKPLDEEEEE